MYGKNSFYNKNLKYAAVVVLAIIIISLLLRLVEIVLNIAVFKP